jgi:hypothetical protein
MMIHGNGVYGWDIRIKLFEMAFIEQAHFMRQWKGY